jgi:hypothetical protein
VKGKADCFRENGINPVLLFYSPFILFILFRFGIRLLFRDGTLRDTSRAPRTGHPALGPRHLAQPAPHGARDFPCLGQRGQDATLDFSRELVAWRHVARFGRSQSPSFGPMRLALGTCMFDLTSSRRLSRARESRSVLFCQADNYLYYSRYNPQCVFPSRACSSTRRPSHGRVERLRKSRGVLLLALRLRPLARDCSLRPLTQELLHLAA